MTDVIKFSIPGKPEYVQMVRLAIGSIASQANFDMDEAEDIKVAVAEACKNVFCHGREGFSDFYEISCEIGADHIEISVTDTRDDVGSARQEGDKPADKHNKLCRRCPDDGNLGVIVIESLMDEVEIDTDEKGNKRIRMVKNR